MTSPNGLHGLHGTAWLTARQHRRVLWAALTAVLLAAAAMTALRIWDARHPATSDDNTAYQTLTWAMENAGPALLLLPLLAGAFVAGPLIAREFETGTHRLALTQSVTPAAWLRAKLLTVTAALLAGTLPLLAVWHLGWTRIHGTALGQWGERGPYEASGIVLIAYDLAAVAVGALVGQLIRRTLLAMAATGTITGLILLTLGALRWSFLPTTRATGPASPIGSYPELPHDALTVDSGLLTASGARFDGSACWSPAQRAAESGGTWSDGAWNTAYDSCLADHQVTTRYTDYHPVSHFWPTQLIETGIVLTIAALTLYAAFRVLRSRLP
ncbi:ABC transporter permease [Streptomyces sp. NPDC090025]|uniref:ABC transporter permease n=1 Tax=Streptomyces sp. NPDC090025 TaxID=3365922 RepID=UPI00383267F2